MRFIWHVAGCSHLDRQCSNSVHADLNIFSLTEIIKDIDVGGWTTLPNGQGVHSKAFTAS